MLRLLILTVLFLASLARSASATPGVLVVFTDERVMPAHAEFEAALRAQLGLPDAQIEYSAEFLDSTRFGGPDADALWRDFLKRKYAGHDLRVIVAAAPAAFEFLLEHQHELFPGLPVIVTAVPADRVGDRPLPANYRVLPFAYDFARTLEIARRLQPAATDIVVPVGTNQADLRWEEALRRELPSGPGTLPVRYIKGLPLEAMVREVATLTPLSIGLLVPINRDGAGRARIPLDAMTEIVTASGAPFYSVFSTTLGIGAVGGQITTYAHTGRWVGRFVQRLLDGETLASIPTPPLPPSNAVVDWRALQQWRLDEARLPPGAEVLFKTPLFWQQYGGLIVTQSALVGMLAASLVALLMQRRRRDLAEREVHAVRSELAHLTRVSLMGELSASLAHELNQPLTAILANAQAAERFMRSPQPDLDTIRDILADIASDDRRAGEVIRRLRELFKKGEPKFQRVQCSEIVDSVLRLANTDLISRGVMVTTSLDAALPAVNGDRVQLQQVLLNLIMNAADAVARLAGEKRRITIRTSRGPKATVELTVSDLGDGIPSDQLARVFEPFVTTKADGLGMGLSISRTIVEAHGGRLSANNNPDRGVTLRVVLPAA